MIAERIRIQLCNTAEAADLLLQQMDAGNTPFDQKAYRCTPPTRLSGKGVKSAGYDATSFASLADNDKPQ